MVSDACLEFFGGLPLRPFHPPRPFRPLLPPLHLRPLLCHPGGVPRIYKDSITVFDTPRALGLVYIINNHNHCPDHHLIAQA